MLDPIPRDRKAAFVQYRCLVLLAGTETTKLKVATGDYNAKIDARIAEITAACGAQ